MTAAYVRGKYMPTLLYFVEKTHPILREVMPKVHDFNDPKLHDIIHDMCYSILPKQLHAANAPFSSAAGMAANQWGIKKRIFIFTPDGSEEGKQCEVMINPSYLPYLQANEVEPQSVTAYEGCFSIPLTTGMVKRYEAILATYYNPLGEKIERVMQGWEARVFQHETDHLDGKLYDGRCDHFPGPECLERIIFNDAEEMEQFWENKVKASRSEDSGDK
jgi:peptide deformylase